MKIQNSGLSGVNGADSSKPIRPADHQSSSRAGSVDSDSDIVNLSSASQLLATAKSLTAPGRQAKLDGIASLLRSGSYQPDTFEVGQAIVQDHLRK